MEIFSSGQRSGYEEIVNSGPRWWTEYREMDAVYRYEGWLLDLMIYLMERVVENQFPEYADEAAISALERLLKIEYDTSDPSLDERRKTVSTYYTGSFGKLNRTSILNMAEKYTGCPCSARWEGSTLIVTAVGDLDENILREFKYTKLQSILQQRMPAHLNFLIKRTYGGFRIEHRHRVVQERISLRFNAPWVNDGFYLDGSYLLDGSAILDFYEMNPARVTVITDKGSITEVL